MRETDIVKKVLLPNGDVSVVKLIGASTIGNFNTITDVFHIPQFKFNLLSVSKLTKELHMYATFFSDFCVF